MGLRINTNVSAIRALRNLQINERSQSLSLERLSTGLRINRGSDDPSGLIISEQLRSQVSALNQAVSNSQSASSLVTIADAALAEVSDLLIGIQDSIVFAQNTGGASPDQITAEQETVDNAIAAIDRIANTTRYADRALLNGQAEYQITDAIPADLNDITIRSLNFPGDTFERTLTVTPTINPQRASILFDAASSVGGATIRITGARGTADVVIASASGADDIADAVNTVAGFTGVYASGAGGGNLLLRSQDFGESSLIKVETVSGSVEANGAGGIQTLDNSTPAGAYVADAAGAALTAGEIVTDQGRDGEVTFDGSSFTAVGNKFNILTPTAQFEFTLDPDSLTEDALPAAGAAGPTLLTASSFTVANTGLTFQLNELPQPTDQLAVGIQAVNVNRLGFESVRDRVAEAEEGQSATIEIGGFLSTLKTGAGNDLFQNPDSASAIVRHSITQVASTRGFLGAVQANSIEPNINSLGVAIENLSASLAEIRDLDFAQETTNFTKNQILFQSGIAVLASANLIPQSILTLLS